MIKLPAEVAGIIVLCCTKTLAMFEPENRDKLLALLELTDNYGIVYRNTLVGVIVVQETGNCHIHILPEYQKKAVFSKAGITEFYTQVFSKFETLLGQTPKNIPEMVRISKKLGFSPTHEDELYVYSKLDKHDCKYLEGVLDGR